MPRKKKVSTAKSRLLTIPEAAIKLNVCRGTVYNLIHHEALPTITLGGVWRVHPDALQMWLKEHERLAA
jgi:excisionase family DNA binding protein